MPQRAHVTSLEAIEAFRSNLIVYVNQARPTLEELSAEVLRTRQWLENEQRLHWEHQLKRSRRSLEEAQQALFSARLGNLRQENSGDQLAVRRAKQAVDEAELKLRSLKKWAREFEGRIQPLLKQTERLHTTLSNDMVQAAAYLAQVVNTLAAYAELAPPSAGASSQVQNQAGASSTASLNSGTPPVSNSGSEGGKP
ncbi:MAG TPA: hypothetical protein VNZ22_14175 [Bacillota bacterium]|nr:hypothetical protein [Bacillota bacterium]